MRTFAHLVIEDDGVGIPSGPCRHGHRCPRRNRHAAHSGFRPPARRFPHRAVKGRVPATRLRFRCAGSLARARSCSTKKPPLLNNSCPVSHCGGGGETGLADAIALQSVVSRNVDPIDSAVVSICTLAADSASNSFRARGRPRTPCTIPVTTILPTAAEYLAPPAKRALAACYSANGNVVGVGAPSRDVRRRRVGAGGRAASIGWSVVASTSAR